MRGLKRLGALSYQTRNKGIKLIDEENNIVIAWSPQAIADVRAVTALIAQERDVFYPNVELYWNPDSGRWHAHHP